MSIEAIKYAAIQISKHFDMLNKEGYRNARIDNFLRWHKGVKEKIFKGEITTKPNNILYSASVAPFSVKETLPNGFRFYFYEGWSYVSAKMDYRITIEKIIKQVNWDKPTSEDIIASSKFFNTNITTETLRKSIDFKRKITKLLKRYTANIIIVTNKTTYEDILIQLIILALQDKFIEMDKETVSIFRSYINRKIHLNKCTKQLIKDLLFPQKGVQPKSLLSAETILYYIVRNYIRPYNAYTFKFYLKEIIQGLHKEEKRKEAIIIPRGLKTIQLESPYQDSIINKEESDDKSHLQDNLTENFNKFQIFYSEQGEEIGIGVDRAAIEFGTSRDKIYRLIRKNQIRVRRIEGTYVLDDQAQKKLLEVLRKKQAYQKLILDLSFKRKIKLNSARKRIIRRTKNKTLLF